MTPDEPFIITKGNLSIVPAIHYNMEFAAQVHLAFRTVKPDCIAVELAETMELQLLHAASRLPDVSVILTTSQDNEPLVYMCEPCDAAFEGLRCGLESQIPCHCIDLDVDSYPDIKEHLPDPYAIQRIGLKEYYQLYQKIVSVEKIKKSKQDNNREVYMAKRLKELSLRHDKVLFICGMSHVDAILKLLDESSFPDLHHTVREVIELCTLTEQSAREVMAEPGWITSSYEYLRREYDNELHLEFPPDRQKLIYRLFKDAGQNYQKTTKLDFPGYNQRNLMKFARNYALTSNQLMPDLYQILATAKGCVDHNYAYETWLLATNYPYRKNIDGLPELDLSIDQVWGHSKIIRFNLKAPQRKGFDFQKRRRKDRSNFRFEPPGPFSICSYPPEDHVIENFGDFLKKKGTQILSEEGAHTIPFTTSIEDGIDTRETIRHWHEKKLYVKVKGKPPGGVGSVVVIFDSDSSEEGEVHHEIYPWKTTWLGENEQESDMAFYATLMGDNVVGPGISRCEYGGFMMSYPPRRMLDIWQDPDYDDCRNKSEILLMAAIDYSVDPSVVYVAHQPPRNLFKRFAARFGKKIVYIPIGQLSSITLNQLRTFHVLDGHHRRDIADDYIV